MSVANLVRAEGMKLGSAASTWIITGVTILGTWPQAWSNSAAYALSSDDPRLFGAPVPIEFRGFELAGFGYVFVVVLGAVWAASEYGATRQITTTLTASPRRLRVHAMKAMWLVVTTATMAFLAMAGAVMVTHAATSDGIDPLVLTPRIWQLIGGLVVSWTLTGLLAFALATIARTAIVPLIVLLPLVVGLGSFLAGIVEAARYLPIVAGDALYSAPGTPGVLDPLVGGGVQLAWTAVAVAIAGVVFVRRDA